MVCRILAGTIYGLTMFLASCAFAQHAMALDIRCIEASKYKYLWQIFHNERDKFANFLGVQGSSGLPEPEMCRAVIVTGTIGKPEAVMTRRDVLGEIDKFLEAIAQNKGWLADIYLSSPGGRGALGLMLGELARIFWLKTNTINGNVWNYFPDFGSLSITKIQDSSGQTPVGTPEPFEELATGWREYMTATRGLSQIKPPAPGRCISACSFLYVGGVDRHGITFVHRPRPQPHLIESPAIIHTTLEEMETHAADAVVTYLEYMGAGTDIIQKTELTPSEENAPASAPRFPPEVSKIIRSQCGETDGDDLERQEVRIRTALTDTSKMGETGPNLARLQGELGRLRGERSKIERCIATSVETRRVAQFAKYCSSGICNRAALLVEFERSMFAADQLMADKGRARAQFLLGDRYEHGRGVTANYGEALKWYRLAAEQSDARAQNNLGNIYANGRGVRRDYGEALKWYRLAAGQGEANAQNNLGLMYSHGWGVPQDYAEAARWLRLSADQGRADAQRLLGFMYLNGQGVPRNDIHAYMWFSLSASLGNKEAAIVRDQLAKRLVQSQIDQAEKLAGDWKISHHGQP